MGVRLITGALFIGSALPLFCATAIFDNSVNDLTTRFDPGTNQVGDEILLAGTARYLTFFDFEYWGVNTANPSAFAGNVQADVRFYVNNGAPFNGYATPGTLFFDSGWFGGFSPTDQYPYRATIAFTDWPGLDFPIGGLLITNSDITWSVQFRGMGATDTVGVDLYSPPVVGADYSDYWQPDAFGNWTLLTNSVAMDFGARMFANEVVPEPSSLVLALVSSLGMLAFARRFRRQR